MIGFLLPGVVFVVMLLKARFKVLGIVLALYAAANVIALLWAGGADDGASLPIWLIAIAIALWLGMLGSLMVEPEEGSWWGRNRLDERFSVFFRLLGILLLIACPVSLGVAYALEDNTGAVVVMALFAAALGKAFVWDEMRA